MPPEIPAQFRFEVLLSHTFPGFFVALSVFMLLDVLSPLDLTSWAFGTVASFLSAMGFIILSGTIFGVIVDGVHHWIIEDHIFKKCLEYDKLEKERENLYPSRVIKHLYYFTRIGEEAFTYLTDNYYRYSEFYANIFISLIPFSIISPLYFCYILKISYLWSIILGFVTPLALACLCILSSYDAFIIYHQHRRDMIYGFLESTKSINVKPSESSIIATGSECTSQKLKKWREEHKRLAGVIILIIIIVVIGVAIFSLLSSPLTLQIVVEPRKLDVSISPGDSVVKTISIGAIGRGDRVTLNATGPIAEWVNFSKNNVNFRNNITVEVDKTQYINVNLSIPSNTTPGEYRGAIEITPHKHGKVRIPILVKIQ
jgi:hypothetical protein